MTNIYAQQNVPTEWGFSSARDRDDPFNQVVLDVEITDPSGARCTVPAFWDGEERWRIRYASTQTGTHRWRTRCSDATDSGLHDLTGELVVRPYRGSNVLYRRGGLQVAAGGRHLEHADGTPFFWLGDTWWLGMTGRLAWPGDFDVLVDDRAGKGFSVVQTVLGLPPDCHPFDPRVENEGGYAWEPQWSRINPAFFAQADLRLHWLVRHGLVPCIFGCWGWYIHWLGVAKMKQHWRTLVARYGALPVVWCLCGEVLRPYQSTQELDATPAAEGYDERTRAMWRQVADYVRAIDPYRRLITVHPQRSSRSDLVLQPDEHVVDIDFLQTGHHDRVHLPRAVQTTVAAYQRQPAVPVINSEAVYEGMMGYNGAQVQRMWFWVAFLSGACGFTYGADGLWCVNGRDDPFGVFPHGQHSSGRPWQEAFQLPGSRQLGIAKRLLTRYRWWQLEPRPQWVEPHWSTDDYDSAYCAGIPDEVRICYLSVEVRIAFSGPPSFAVVELEPDAAYQAYYADPETGDEHPAGTARPDRHGRWSPPAPPMRQDWVLVLETAGARSSPEPAQR